MGKKVKCSSGKNNLVFAGLMAVSLFLAAGCSSTKEAAASADTYEDAVAVEDTYDDEEGTKLDAKKKSEKKSSSGFSLLGLFGSKFRTIGEASVYTPQIFGGIKQTASEVILYPKKETVGFASSYQAAYYYLTFNPAARKAFIKAVDQYYKDFENKKLNRNDKKSYKQYGKINADVYWGTVKGNSPNYGEGSLMLGYKFYEKSPYFTITMYGCTNEAFVEGSSEMETSMHLYYYFTKNQAKMLCDQLTDENIQKVLYEYEIEQTGTPEAEDSYIEADSEDEVSDVE